FRNRLQGLYLRAATLHRATEAYRTPLVDLNPSALLQKSLAAGEISLLDYLTELGYYYDTLRQALETERDFRKAFAELSATGL
ncbi:MAG: transporter, partial [Tannerella sp.]|nr:transporter [Tannerella sp.]